jgi:predicted ester cyclase
MTRDDVLAVVARRRDAMDRRDMEALGEVYAETAELESPLAGSTRGRDAVVASVGAFFSAFANATLVYDEPIIEGDRVAIFAEVSGTDVGGIMGLPPSGRSFRFPVAFALTIRDHRIVEERRIYDFTGLLVQVGALKAKPA